MEELWKSIEGYEGKYQVSNLGRVKSLSRMVVSRWGTKYQIKEKYLSAIQDKDGYLIVCLKKNGKGKNFKVHRLVAKAFVPGMTETRNHINHLDETRNNNRSDNLEWVTPKENNNYLNHAKHISVSKMKKVRALDDNGNVIRIFDSISQAREEMNAPAIWSVINGKISHSGGYKWEFV